MEIGSEEFELLANETVNEHAYVGRERGRYLMHPGVKRAINQCGLVPSSMKSIILQWPHVSNDGLRLAYTRSIDQGEHDRQTLTSVGRYLTASFPEAKANVIRDIAALYQSQNCRFTDRTVEAYIEAVQNGPSSCMRFDNDTVQADDYHPYRTYAPKYGWHMAIRETDDYICGRCMCLEHEGQKLFVRSYYRNAQSSCGAGSDTVLEA